MSIKKELKRLGIDKCIKACESYKKFANIKGDCTSQIKLKKYNLDKFVEKGNTGACTWCIANNLLVLDLDIHCETGDPLGEENIKRYFENLNVDFESLVDMTYCVNTSSGGKHYYFKLSDEQQLELTELIKHSDSNKINFLDKVDLLFGESNIVLPYSKVEVNKGINKGTVGEYSPMNDNQIRKLNNKLFNLIVDKLNDNNNKLDIKNEEMLNNENKENNVSIFQPLSEGEGRDNHLMSALGVVCRPIVNLTKQGVVAMAFGINSQFKEPFPKEVVIEKAKHYYEDYYLKDSGSYRTKKGKLIPFRLAKIIAKNGGLFFHNEKFYKYDNGVYKFIKTEKLQDVLEPYLRMTEMRKSNYGEMESQLKGTCNCDRLDWSVDRININNGILCLNDDSVTLEPHSMDFKSITQLPVNYKEDWNLNDAPAFLETLTNLCQGDEDMMQLIQEIGGSCLVPITKLKQIFVFQGVTNSLKSGIQNAIVSVIGKKNTCHIKPDSMVKSDNFQVSEMFGKLANIVGEVTTIKSEATDTLKSITGGDMLNANVKNKGMIQFESTVTNVWAFNGDIKFNNDGGALTSRLIIIPCTYQVPKEKQDASFYLKFDNERDIIFMWFLEGLKRLIKNNFRFTEVAACNESVKEFDKSSNSLKYWMEEQEFDFENDRILVKPLYRNYCDFIEDEFGFNRIKNFSLHMFKKSLKNLNYEIIETRINQKEYEKHGNLGYKLRQKVYIVKKKQ